MSSFDGAIPEQTNPEIPATGSGAVGLVAVTPRVYSRLFPVKLIGWGGRLISLLIATTCLAVLMTAVRLTPNPAGTGTHTGMGLNKCGMIITAGIPCATCGMTTSFAWFVRGNFLASVYVQPMGFVLALATALAFWVCLYIATTGKPVYRLIWIIPTRYYLLPLMFLALAAWAWKIYIFVRGIDGWR